MKIQKDNFSNQSADYAKYRPAYPPELFTFLYSLVKDKEAAWDCGTGNGQVAMELSKVFDKVYATDITSLIIFIKISLARIGIRNEGILMRITKPFHFHSMK